MGVLVRVGVCVKVGEEVEIVGLRDETRKTVVTSMEMFHKILDSAEAIKLGEKVMKFINDEGHVIAVLDWEMCTLGDSLADLGLLRTCELRRTIFNDREPDARGGDDDKNDQDDRRPEDQGPTTDVVDVQ